MSCHALWGWVFNTEPLANILVKKYWCYNLVHGSYGWEKRYRLVQFAKVLALHLKVKSESPSLRGDFSLPLWMFYLWWLCFLGLLYTCGSGVWWSTFFHSWISYNSHDTCKLSYWLSQKKILWLKLDVFSIGCSWSRLCWEGIMCCVHWGPRVLAGTFSWTMNSVGSDRNYRNHIAYRHTCNCFFLVQIKKKGCIHRFYTHTKRYWQVKVTTRLM